MSQMRITDDQIKAIEGTVADVTITGTGVYSPSHRTVSLSQPNYSADRKDEDDFILLCDVSDLPKLIAALQEIQKAYETTHLYEGDRSEEYACGWNDSIKHHTGERPDGGYRGPLGVVNTEYDEGWNDAWDFL